MTVNWVIGVALIIIAIVVALRIVNRMTHPITRKAGATVRKLREAKLYARLLKGTKLLNVSDLGIKQIGEAMVVDGATISEANTEMLRLMEEKITRDIEDTVIAKSAPSRKIVGME